MGGADRDGWADALRRAEISAGVPKSAARDRTGYRRVNRWLLSDRVWMSEIARRWTGGWGSFCEIPYLTSQPTGDLLRAGIRDREVIRSTAADALVFETNIRSFYIFRERATIKLLGPTRRPDEFRRDAEIRKAISDTGTVPVPRIISEDLSASPPWILEELIAGRKMDAQRDQDLLTAQFVPRIWSLYEAFGLSPEPFAAHFDLDEIRERLGLLPLPAEWRLERDCRDALVRHLDALGPVGDEAVAVSLGHGDLAAGNLILSSDGRIYLVDWELARRMPVALDFRKLLLSVPGLWRGLSERLATAAGRGERLMPPGPQLLAAVAARLADRQRALASETPPGRAGPIRYLKRIGGELRRFGDALREGAFA